MQLPEEIEHYIRALQPVRIHAELTQRIFSLIDLTSLNETDTEASIAAFCEKATKTFGHVAAVCVYPKFVRLVADNFAGTSIKTATVVNFPQGTAPLESVLIEINNVLENGAHEIDMVFPYDRFLSGDKDYTSTFVSTCKAACGNDAVLKVIIETGALKDLRLISSASEVVLTAGADFVKTSTGKIEQGATLEAAAAILVSIRQFLAKTKHAVGFKVSGGIRTLEQAVQYMELADNIMGREWVTPAMFRIGASKLVDEIK